MRGLYIAGPIDGVKNYRERFEAAELAAKQYGWAVLNPAKLPNCLPRNRYMPTCIMMVNAADAVLMLDGWEDSAGARLEHDFAVYQGLRVFKQEYFGGNIPPVIRERRD